MKEHMKSELSKYSSVIENDKITFTNETSETIPSILLGIGLIILAIYLTKDTAKTVFVAIISVIGYVAAMSSRPFIVAVDSQALTIRYKLYPYQLFPGFIRTKVFTKDMVVSIMADPKITGLFGAKTFTAQVKVLTNRKTPHTIFSSEQASIEAARHESENLATMIAAKLGISVHPVEQNVSALTSRSS